MTLNENKTIEESPLQYTVVVRHHYPMKLSFFPGQFEVVRGNTYIGFTFHVVDFWKVGNKIDKQFVTVRNYSNRTNFSKNVILQGKAA